jgi:hypothetical protein
MDETEHLNCSPIARVSSSHAAQANLAFLIKFWQRSGGSQNKGEKKRGIKPRF